MTSRISGTTSLHDAKAVVKPRLEWKSVRASVTRLYIDRGKTLKQVILIMKRDGFVATPKQYKTKFRKWGLQKYQKPGRYLPNGNRSSESDDAESSTASEVEESRVDDENTSSGDATIQDDGDIQLYQQAQTSFLQPIQAGTYWRLLNANSLHESRFNTMTGSLLMIREPHYRSYSSSIINVRTLLHHCEIGLTYKILESEDIMQIEGMANFFTVAGSHRDAFTFAHALLSHVAAAPPLSDTASYLSRTAVTVLRNALCLYDCRYIENLLGMTLQAGTEQGPRNDEYWCVLSSLFGLVLHGSSSESQRSLQICHAAAAYFRQANFSGSFDWRYLILITNSYYLCTKKSRHYDVIAAWSGFYLLRRPMIAISNLSDYLECLLAWCITILDDSATWKRFTSFEPDLWTTSSDATYHDISELECKTLFCYFWSCLQRRSRSNFHSECHIALLKALNGLQTQFNTTPLAALSTIARMLLYSHADQHLDRNRSTLIRRALCRIQRIRLSKPPVGILCTAGWEGSVLSANFLETLSTQYSLPYFISSEPYRKRVDDAVRDFAERHFKLKFSMQAFVHNPFVGQGYIRDAECHTRTTLIDLIMDKRSLR